MAKRRRLSALSLSAAICAALASSDHVMRQTAIGAVDAVRSSPRHLFNQLSVQGSSYDALPSPASPTEHSMDRLLGTRAFSGSPCAITTAPTLENYRREVDDQAVTIVVLSSALASANSHATAVSKALASSISDLQASAAFLSRSASSAILSIHDSASRALQAAEASALDAVLLAEESASSRVNEVLALATMTALPTAATPVNGTAYRAQIATQAQKKTVSLPVVAVAVVVSIVGSTLLSILGFYIFAKRRGAKKKSEEQQLELQKRQEEEVHVSAALDRAIVSYIAKESPPTSPDGPGAGQMPNIQDMVSNERHPLFLLPPPRSSHRPLPPPPAAMSPLTSPRSPPQPPTYPAVPTHARSRSSPSISSLPPQSPHGHVRTHSSPDSPPRSPPRTASYALPPLSSPGPPPTAPLPQLPSTTYVPKRSLRRKASRPRLDENDQIYGEVLRTPLTSTSVHAPWSPDTLVPTEPVPESNRTDSNWPLTANSRGQWM